MEPAGCAPLEGALYQEKHPNDNDEIGIGSPDRLLRGSIRVMLCRRGVEQAVMWLGDLLRPMNEGPLQGE